MKQFLKFPGWSLSLLALVISFTATAQFGEGYYSPSTNIGQLSHGVGTGAQAFKVFAGGSFDGFTNGISTDNFIGPNGIAGMQEIGGIVAPIFDTLKFNNGSANVFDITNTAGIKINGALVFNNGITTTVRTNRTAGLAGAIQFLGSAVYTPALLPGAGTDPKFTDGFISKVNPAGFMYPIGNVTDMRPITVTGTGTFTAAWSNLNVATPYPYTAASLPTGVTLTTNGYWEWSGTGIASATLSIPSETSFSTASQLAVLAYNGSTWTNLGGVFGANTENSINASPVSVPANTMAIAIGQSVPYVQLRPRVFLQGAMNAGLTAMTTALHSYIPLVHPYNIAAFGSYAGIESLTTIPTSMTDWVLVDLRDSTSPKTTIVATQAAMLMNDGVILSAAGDSTLTFLNVNPKNYYIGIRHRNHLAIRSSSFMALNNSPTVYDFRTSASSAYTDPAITTNTSMKNLGNGNYAMWGGNVNSNTTVRVTGPPTQSDYLSLTLSALNGNNATVITGVYNAADLNMNGVVRATGNANINDYLYLVLTVLAGSTSVIYTQHL